MILRLVVARTPLLLTNTARSFLIELAREAFFTNKHFWQLPI